MNKVIASARLAGGLAVMLASTPALAQPASEEAPTYDGEILVTAQKRSQSLQDVPITMSAFGTDQLSKASTSNLENLSLLIPSVSISNHEGRGQISIRGIGVVGVFDIAESAVATHIDGFYVPRLSGTVSSFMDIERVEVLKGPQGTLYGRNATAGAINIITNKPGADFRVSGSVEGLYIDGNGSDRNSRDPNAGHGYGVKATAVLNAPISDSIRFRIAGMKVNRDGFRSAYYPDGRKVGVNDADEVYLRAQLAIDLGPQVDWLIATDNYWADDRGTLITFTGKGRPDVEITGVTPSTPNGGRTRRIFINSPVTNKPRTHAVTSTLTWRASDHLTLRSLSQYRYTKYATFGDLDSTQTDAGFYRLNMKSDAFTQEFQLNGEWDKLKLTSGLFYFQEKEPLTQEYYLALLGPGGHVDPAGTNKTKSYAVFTDLTYSLTDTLDVTAGGRYSIDRKGGLSTFLLECCNGVTAVNDVRLKTKTFKSFTPKFVVNYKPTPDLTFYGSIQKGFKSGGYNLGDSVLNLPYDPEKITAYEAGAKTRFFDRRLVINPAIFFYDYKDLQIEDTITLSGGGGAGTVQFRNAATSEVFGAEVDGYVLPVDGLRLDFNAAYLDAKFTSGSLSNPTYPGTPAVDLDGNPLPKAPKFSFTGGITYDVLLKDEATITPNFTASYRSRQYFSSFKDRTSSQAAYWWLRASLTYAPADKRWSVALFGDNLTNKLAYTYAKPSTESTGFALQTSMMPPRTFGIRLNWGM